MTSTELRNHIDKQLARVITRDTHKGAAARIRHQLTDAIMLNVKDHVVYVIGDDEKANISPRPPGANKFNLSVPRNNLRAEQRNRAGGY